MKKILSLILAGLMTVSCAAFVAADDAAVEATTDPVQDYAIEFLANCGVFKGGEGLTNEDLIQRYQMALFVSRISTGWVDDATWEDGTANDATFKDIDTEPASKYLGALSYANQNGIIEGYTANTFAPYASITYRDALTMVVRTLGYKGLSYPWGNIEKAVELGLTEGVDAAYTDELTRGEVAVIIYNAMFAKNSKGETLAKSIFGYDYGFQNIVIVSTDEYGYAANGDRADAGYVGFKTIDENGVLGSKVYYVKASEFGFEGHEEELAVGEVFVALFEIDGDYTNMIDVASMKTATVMNNGITDNEGKAYETMPIAAALADYTLVKDYNNGILNYTYDDLRVYAYGKVDVYDLDGNAAYVGIDANHNIVKWTVCSESTHGTANTNCKCAWEIAWFYNKELDRYYDYIVDADNSKRATGATADYTAIADGRVYINWMSPDEFTEWYNGAIKKVLASYYELQLQEAPATAITNGKAPYAKLNLFNIDEDAQAEIATYKSYSIGIISKNTTDYKCKATNNSVDHSAGVVMPAYVITDLEGGNKDYVFVEEGHTAHDVDLTKGFGWLNVDESVTTFDEAKGGVVLYNWNKTTGEIEIVKHITEGTNDDADSGIITGVLQAYSTKNETVTIDGTVYPIDYDNLSGDTFAMDGTLAKREVVAVDLDEQYMQYVTAVVCDGYVVDIDLRGNDTDAIVVLDYAGITSDGYIAVYGYKTDALKLDVFKINSYNGWKKGDYRYNPENATTDHAFDFGALYTIKSYDSATQSYGVYTENVETVLENATPVRVTFKNGYRVVTPMDIVTEVVNNNRQFTWTAKDGAASKVVAMTSADKYVIVTDSGNDLSSNIFVYDGIIDSKDEGAYAIDAMLVGALDSKTLVLYDLNTLNLVNAHEDLKFDDELSEDWYLWGDGFRRNAYEVGYVLYEGGKGTVLEAAYDDAQAADWYLLGSTLSEVRTMNLLTGDRDYVFASKNIDLVAGHIYKTIGGCIIKDVTDGCYDIAGIHDFIAAIEDAYHSNYLNYADYMVETDVVLTKDTYGDLLLAYALGLVEIDGVDPLDKKDWKVWDEKSGKHVLKFPDFDVEKAIEAALEEADTVDKSIADAMIDTVKFYLIDEDYNWNWGYAHDEALAVEVLEKLADGKTYTADLVYNVAGKDVVVYIWDEDLNGKDDNGDGIDDIVVPTEYEGSFLDGKDDVKIITTKDLKADATKSNFKWTYTENDGTVRYFDVKISYTYAVTFKENTECKDIDYIELLNLGAEIVEMVWDKDNTTWVSKSIEDCESGLHDLLAKAGIGFGHIDDLNAKSLTDKNGTAGWIDATAADFDSTALKIFFEEEDIKVIFKDECGLVTGFEFDLEETVPVYEDGEIVDWKNIRFNTNNDKNDVTIKVHNTSSDWKNICLNLIFDYAEIINATNSSVMATGDVIGIDTTKTDAVVFTFGTEIGLKAPKTEDTSISIFG